MKRWQKATKDTWCTAGVSSGRSHVQGPRWKKKYILNLYKKSKVDKAVHHTPNGRKGLPKELQFL